MHVEEQGLRHAKRQALLKHEQVGTGMFVILASNGGGRGCCSGSWHVHEPVEAGTRRLDDGKKEGRLAQQSSPILAKAAC